MFISRRSSHRYRWTLATRNPCSDTRQQWDIKSPCRPYATVYLIKRWCWF